MDKKKFEAEFEVNASKKMLYPYFNTASGLAQWFADDVNIDEDHIFHFLWDDDHSKAKMVSHRLNSYVKFEFIEDGVSGNGSEDPSFIEFKLDQNELTQSVFVRVVEYTDLEDEEEQLEIWDNLFHTLKETVGG